MSAKGYDEGTCLDFDFAVVSFLDWFDSKKEEKVQRRLRSDEKLKDKHTWAPKYESDDAILSLYYARKGGRAGVALSPALQAIGQSRIDQFLEEWTPDMDA